jgi:uncharacterized protein (TIGR02145 family)
MKNLCYNLLIFVFSISSFAQSNTFTDKRDGKVYKTVKIGSQIWMAENLAFKADKNCWAYDNDQNNVAKYGYFYSWKEVCPSGWHLPGKEEFETLINNWGDSGKAAYEALLPGGKSGFSALFGGSRLDNGRFEDIEKDAFFWSSTVDTDDDDEFSNINNEFSAWCLYIRSDLEEAGIIRCIYTYGSGNWLNGLSVRCIKND